MELIVPTSSYNRGYLLGSIPTAFVAGKFLKGIDLRDYGSGTVSGSMIWSILSLDPLSCCIFDMIKGAGPVWVSLALEQNSVTAASAGLAAIAVMIGRYSWDLLEAGVKPFLGILIVLSLQVLYGC